MSGSPQLIAAVHVLHRLSSPRHPPCALDNLIVAPRRFHKYGSTRSKSEFDVHSNLDCQRAGAPGRGAQPVAEDQVARKEPIDGFVVHRPREGDRDDSKLHRKEVIQPQVPLRLPCYDFTPVADPTVVGCLHCWLAHRLQVKPTPMV